MQILLVGLFFFKISTTYQQCLRHFITSGFILLSSVNSSVEIYSLTLEQGCLYSGLKMKCCLKLCGNDIFEQSESRVEVKTVLPSRFDGKNFLVSWNRNGEAIFHLPCWQRLLKSKPTTNYKKLGAKRSRLNSSELVTKQEKSLIREAKKTAEFFDSAEQIKKEASRVAGWLLSAKHCVVFTGRLKCFCFTKGQSCD